MNFPLAPRDGPLGRTRAFSPFDHSCPEVADFVRTFVTESGYDDSVEATASEATLHAFTLFVNLGMEEEEIHVNGQVLDGQLIIELTNGLDFHKVLREELRLLNTTNRDLVALIATIDELQIGHLEDGRSFMRLAIQLPASEA